MSRLAPLVLLVLAVLGPGCGPRKAAPGYRVYVTDRDSGAVTVIEPRAGFPSHRVTVGKSPTYVAATARTGLVLVSNSGDATVSFIQAPQDSVVATVAVPGVPKGVAIAPGDSLALVADEAGAQVVVIDLTARSVTRLIPVGAEPHNFAFDTAAGVAYVTCAGTDSVDIISLAALKKTGSLAAGSQPHNIVLLGGSLVVTSRNLPRVYVLDRAGGIDSVAVSTGHHGIAAWAPEGLAYVTGIGAAEVTVLDPAARRTARTVEVGPGPHGIVVSPDGLFYFVAVSREDSVRVFSRPHNMSDHAVAAPGFPFWVAVCRLPAD